MRVQRTQFHFVHCILHGFAIRISHTTHSTANHQLLLTNSQIKMHFMFIVLLLLRLLSTNAHGPTCAFICSCPSLYLRFACSFSSLRLLLFLVISFWLFSQQQRQRITENNHVHCIALCLIFVAVALHSMRIDCCGHRQDRWPSRRKKERNINE